MATRLPTAGQAGGGSKGPNTLTWLAEQPEADYTVLIGATTYSVMSGFAAEGEPGTDALAGMSKVVFSATLSEPPSWANTQLVAKDPVEAVREMKDTEPVPHTTLRSDSRSEVGLRSHRGRSGVLANYSLSLAP